MAGVKLSVRILEMADVQGSSFMNGVQKAHFRGLCRRLSHIDDVDESTDLEVEELSTFSDLRPVFSIRDKGGALGDLRIRIVFGKIPKRSEVIVLGVYKGWNLPIAVQESIVAIFERYLLTNEPAAIAL